MPLLLTATVRGASACAFSNDFLVAPPPISSRPGRKEQQAVLAPENFIFRQG
jgi:hypothetical protein